MATRVCPNGHQWDSSANGSGCPTCRGDAGPAGRLPPPDDWGTNTDGPPPTRTGEAVPSTPALPSIPGYEIEGLLGRGGMGVVYKARHLRLGRPVAVKLLLNAAHPGPRELARFRIEAEALASLQHPNVVQIHEIGEHDLSPFLALELVEGGTLATRLGGKPIPPAEAADLVAVLAAAAHAFHLRGVVHRDLKPANVLLCSRVSPRREDARVPEGRDYIPKITDFGLAKRLDQDAHTHTGAVMGTPSYMAPEQAQARKEIGPQADVYALGAILYECLTGKPPFQSDSTFDALLRVIEEEPPRPRTLRPETPADLETICLKCLQKDPARRYASALDLDADLRRWLAGEPIEARPVGSLERAYLWVKRRPVESGLAALVALTALAGAWVALGQYQEARSARVIADERAEREAEARGEAQEAFARAERELYLSSVALADREWRQNNLQAFRQALDRCPVGLRNWEWHQLRRRDNNEVHAQSGHHAFLQTAAFSPDGTRLAVALADGAVRLCDAVTGAKVSELPGGGEFTCGLAWSPDGTRLLVAGCDNPYGDETDRVGYVRVWTLAGDAPRVVKVGPHKGGVLAVAHHPTRPQLAAATGDLTGSGEVVLWNLDGPTKVQTLTGHQGPVCAVAYSPDGKRLASGGEDGAAIVWDLATGKAERTLARAARPKRLQVPVYLLQLTDPRGRKVPLLAAGGGVRSLAFSADGNRLFTGGDGLASQWDVASGKEDPDVFRGHPGAGAVGVGPGDWLVTGGRDRTARLWRPGDRREQARLEGHTKEVTVAAVAPKLVDGRRRVLTASLDGTVKVWSPGRERDRFAVPANQLTAFATAFSPDNRTLAIGGGAVFRPIAAGDVRIIDAETRALLFKLKGHGTGISRVAFSPDGKLLASATALGELKLWDLARREAIRTWRIDAEGWLVMLIGLAFSPDGTSVAACHGNVEFGREGTVQVWDVKTGQPKLKLTGHQGGIGSLAYSPDGRWLATGGADGVVLVREADTGKVVKALPGAIEYPLALAWSPDSRRLAAGGGNPIPQFGVGEIRVWDVAEGRELWQVQEERELFCGLAFLPDGQRLVAGYRDRQVKVFETTGGREVLSLPVAATYVCSLAASGDGRFVAAGTWDGAVHVWDGGR